MPKTVLTTRFVRESQTVQIEVAGPWWPMPVFDREIADDVTRNHEVYEALRQLLVAHGFREDDA